MENQYWEKFISIHSQPVIDLVNSVKGTEADYIRFTSLYAAITTIKGSPSKKRRNAHRLYQYLKKHQWIS